MASIQDRLLGLEQGRRFLTWFLSARFLESFTQDQLETCARDGRLPEPLPEPLPRGASQMDGLDRKSLIKRWEESERKLGHRSSSELAFYSENGYWPEQRMRPTYSLQDGCFAVEWRFQPEEEDRGEKD